MNFRFLSVLMSLVLLAAFAARAEDAARNLSGHYQGIGEAAGMVMTLQESAGRVVGRLVLTDGKSFAVNGERSKNGAQGGLRAKGSSIDNGFFLLEERPRGLQILVMPPKADGSPDAAAGQQYSLLRDGVSPDVPIAREKVTSPAPEGPIDVVDFIDQYRDWTARDVTRLYARLDSQSRGLILLYDYATADILWRLCAATTQMDVPAAIISEILERQPMDCATFGPVAAKARASSLFPEFQRRARFQFELVRATVLCHRGEEPGEKCNDVAALSTPLILRWRDAMSIMTEIAGGAPQAEAKAQAQSEVREALTGLPETALPDTTPPDANLPLRASVDETTGRAATMIMVPLARPDRNGAESPPPEVASATREAPATDQADRPATGDEVARNAAFTLPLARPDR
ncbi:MAG: hypothetical protein GC184_13420 [Rhizobiales bacterium]|nr:hypothetical protein [Hyphomicrobiales bacterium]